MIRLTLNIHVDMNVPLCFRVMCSLFAQNQKETTFFSCDVCNLALASLASCVFIVCVCSPVPLLQCTF